jgi:hypothetical protein
MQGGGGGGVSGGPVQFRQRIVRPPYVDPQTTIIYDTDNAEYEGWLTKQSTWLKVWCRGFCIFLTLRNFTDSFVFDPRFYSLGLVLTGMAT